MSHVPKLEVHLDEESYVRLMQEARSRRVSTQDLFMGIVREHLADVDGAEEALRRLDSPESPISLDELKRRLAS